MAHDSEQHLVDLLLVLAPGLKSRLDSLAAGAYPSEACALLLGRMVEGSRTAEALSETRNIATDRRKHYIMAPEDILLAEQQACELGLDVVGVWHSHPDHPAVPSKTDTHSAWPCYSYVITRVSDGQPAELRSWRFENNTFVEERLET